MFKVPARAILLALSLCCHILKGQGNYTIVTEASKEGCVKASASIGISGYQPSDSVFISWSTGQKNVFTINELKAGDYTVNVKIKNNQDSALLDSTIVIKIEDLGCQVYASNHFTPNGDDYNDSWKISNTEFFPNFHLYVYNKWGQQVHHQSGSYTPWDGRWNGINVPDGTYYYVFFYDGRSGEHQKGDLTILR